MASYHREVYQPSFEDGPAYDLQDEEVEDARARLPLLIVIALLVLASFAGVVWLAYNQGLERGMGGAPTIIAAPETPIRTLPSEESDAVPYTGLKIYDEPVPPDEEAESSSLAQLPPSPDVAPTESPETPPAVAEAPPAPPTPTAETQPAATAPPPAPSAPAASGRAMVQVGSYPSEQLAIEAWENFRVQHSSIAEGRTSDIQMADLGERGIWYRVRIGPFADESAAAAACDRLRADGGSCILAAP